MSSKLIGSIRVTPTHPLPGESVLFEVLGTDGKPVDPSLDVIVNGIRGARRYVQYNGPGTFHLRAIVAAGKKSDRASSTVTVRATSWTDVPAAKGADPIRLPATLRRLPLLTAKPVLDTRAPYHLQIAATDTEEFRENMARLFREDPLATHPIDAALAITGYHWDLGDGTPITTRNGLIDYDFSAALVVDEEHRLFDVSCTIDTAGAGSFTVKRTLSVVNTYALCRNRNVIAPPVVDESDARKVLTAFEATITVQNLEAVALSLDKQRVSYERGDREVMGPVQNLTTPLSLKPQAHTTLTVSLPFNQVPADATGIGIVLLGRDPNGRSVHVETHLGIALPDHRTRGLIFRGLAVTRMAAVGIETVQAIKAGPDTSSREATPGVRFSVEASVPTTRIGGNHARRKQLENLPFAADAHQGGLLAGLPPAIALKVEKTDAGLGARKIVPTMSLPLNPSALLQDAVSRAARLAPITRDDLDPQERTNSALPGLSDFAKQVQARVALAEEGADCDPDNLPDMGDDAWTCQIKQQPNGADQMIEWHRHAGFLNARKGDLLLAPGGPAGFIGGLLAHVSPAQHYAHIGIMTRNCDMVTHSTFSEDRLNAYPKGRIKLPFGLADEAAPTDGFEPAVLRYGWPGVVTQWIKGAVGPEGKLADLDNMPLPGEAETEIDAVDPDDPGGKAYPISPFNKYADATFMDGQWQIVPPLVVKPNPLEETADVRARLHTVADSARASKSHYRFFCYTDASMGLNTVAPAEAGWAKDTFPSVCSSFIWILHRRAGTHLEAPTELARTADLEAEDVKPEVGGEVGDSSLDGLYLYRAQEREDAAHWLHDKLKSKVGDEVKERVRAAASKAGIDLNSHLSGLAGGLIDVFSDIGDDVANQMLNAFASDDTSTSAKDSDAWKHLSDARAVSPDNTLLWDPPSKGGLYGYCVPASYFPGKVEQAPRYVWKYVPTHGALKGGLKVAGQLKSRGMVQLSDSLTAFTDMNGHYVLPKVPFGRYTAKAQWDQGDGLVITGQQVVEMRATEQALDFDLQRPAQLYRRLRVTGDLYFMKYYAVGENPRQSFPFDFTVDVAPEPGRNTARWTIPQDYHGIFGSAAFLFLLEADGVVKWNVAWAVSQDGNLVEDMANAVSSAVETISLGFISGLFGSEVNGAGSRSGDIAPNGVAAADGIRIGPSDGTTGLLNFHIENLGL